MQVGGDRQSNSKCQEALMLCNRSDKVCWEKVRCELLQSSTTFSKKSTLRCIHSAKCSPISTCMSVSEVICWALQLKRIERAFISADAKYEPGSELPGWTMPNLFTGNSSHLHFLKISSPSSMKNMQTRRYWCILIMLAPGSLVDSSILSNPRTVSNSRK